MPEHVNQVEFRLFLRDKLRKFDILAFDIFKKQGKPFATVTVSNPFNGQEFLKHYRFRGGQPLRFGWSELNCKRSNKPGQPEPLKVVSLLQKEEDFRSRRVHQTSTSHAAGPSQPIFSFNTLMTGVWNHDAHGNMVFDRKYQDLRNGSITFGRHALVIYLKTATSHGYDWHGRIDIAYAILEHTIPSIESGTRGAITLTLKSPPKFYKIVVTDDLHLYTGGQANSDIGVPNLAMLSLGPSSRKQRVAKLERLCSLHRDHEKNAALCMVYKLLFPNLAMVYQAWSFIKDFSVPDKYWWKTANSEPAYQPTRTIESEMTGLDLALSRSSLHFAEKFQVLALVYEGTLTPARMEELLPYISSTSRVHGTKLTALAIRNLGRQIPTPEPTVKSSEFEITTLREILESNISNAQTTELTHFSLHGKRKQQQHLALTYKATITPTGT